jgi:F-type H+-transporting ATPase subunit a
MATESMEHAGEAAKESGIHIALAAEKLGTFIGIPITNTLIATLIAFVVLVSVGFFVGRNTRLVPSRLQLLLEMAFEYVYDFVAQILGSRDLARKYFPLLMTLFLFIFVANMLHFIPGVGSITYIDQSGHSVPFLRAPNTDLNVTLALTIVVMIVIELAGVFALGLWRYAGKFINFSSPLNFVVGLIELVSEAGRLVSFSFRLFGNIFAGEVLIAVVIFFVPYVLPVPLMAFEVFVGFIQAAVFSMLTLFFIKIAITAPHGGEAH